MLYYFFRYLEQFGISGSHMWSYISFRSILAMVAALIISAWFGEYFIKWMRRHNGTEAQRDAKTDPYGQSKKGVPTMGGIIILVSILVPCLLFGRLRNIYMMLMLVTTVWLGLLGFLDDYLKMKVSKNGLNAKFKLLGQLVLGIGIGLTLWLSPDAVVHENLTIQTDAPTANIRPVVDVTVAADQPIGVVSTQDCPSAIPNKKFIVPDNLTLVSDDNEQATEGKDVSFIPAPVAQRRISYTSTPAKSTVTTIPFVKDNNFHYSNLFKWLGRYRTAAGWVLFVIVITIAVMGVSNGANMNDGMDGMCAGNSAIIMVALAILAYVSSHIEYAAYFNIMYVPGSEELVIFSCAMIGALVGFLWYNTYPALVFMGDTGSLSIGGIIAVLAIIIHKELLLPLLCFVFLAESVSVMLQNWYARKGNKRGLKWRFFRRAPLHDTFRVLDEQIARSAGVSDISQVKIWLNWPHKQWFESMITTRFWIITIICAALAIITLKIR